MESTDTKETMPEGLHVDDWLDNVDKIWTAEIQYAKFVIGGFRCNATSRGAHYKFMSQFHLFCDYRGKRYRVIGASRMGDIWLTDNFDRELGYQQRVYVNDVSNWGAQP